MSARLTYHPLVTDDFVHACRDYFYLVNRHFPERGVLKLVGDRYKLNGDQRTILYRGISAETRSKIRNSLLVNETGRKNLIIDGYNVLLTLLNYRTGKTAFISTDSMLRDAGSLHGKFRDEEVFISCISMLLDFVKILNPGRTEIYLDSPVSHSEKHACLIKDTMVKKLISGDTFVIKSADYALKNSFDGILATSDTAIIEKALLPVIDLPRAVLVSSYQAVFISLNEILFSDKPQNTVDKRQRMNRIPGNK